MAQDKKHSKIEPERIEEESSGIKDSDGDNDDDEDDCLELAADRSLVVNKLGLQSVYTNKGLANLEVTALAEVLDRVKQAELNEECIDCLKAFQ